MMLLGVTGGSLYFLTENASLVYTTATNTSLIVCTCPIFAMLLLKLVYPKSECVTKMMALGSVIACLGMAVVVLNGRFVLHLSPLGDMLAFGACICWAFYSLMMKDVLRRYDTFFITRKVFFLWCCNNIAILSDSAGIPTNLPSITQNACVYAGLRGGGR